MMIVAFVEFELNENSKSNRLTKTLLTISGAWAYKDVLTELTC